MSFLRSPQGNVFHIGRIGGAKAIEGGFLLLEIVDQGLLEYSDAPTSVALAWRDALAEALTSYRPKRPVTQIDWLGIAATKDEVFARENGWVPADKEGPADNPSSVPPQRKTPDSKDKSPS